MTENDGTYLAEPTRAAGAGVLVVHDWYGLLPHVRAAGDELAAAGLVALAPDLYGGRTATDPAQAEALMEGMDKAAARARLDEAVATLRDRVGGGPVGVLGWSLGGMSPCSRRPPATWTRPPSTTPPSTPTTRPRSAARSCSTGRDRRVRPAGVLRRVRGRPAGRRHRGGGPHLAGHRALLRQPRRRPACPRRGRRGVVDDRRVPARPAGRRRGEEGRPGRRPGCPLGAGAAAAGAGPGAWGPAAARGAAGQPAGRAAPGHRRRPGRPAPSRPRSTRPPGSAMAPRSPATASPWPTAWSSCSRPARSRWCWGATAASCSAACSPCAGSAATGWSRSTAAWTSATRQRAPGRPRGSVAGEDLAVVTGRGGTPAHRPGGPTPLVAEADAVAVWQPQPEAVAAEGWPPR